MSKFSNSGKGTPFQLSFVSTQASSTVARPQFISPLSQLLRYKMTLLQLLPSSFRLAYSLLLHAFAFLASFSNTYLYTPSQLSSPQPAAKTLTLALSVPPQPRSPSHIHSPQWTSKRDTSSTPFQPSYNARLVVGAYLVGQDGRSGRCWARGGYRWARGRIPFRRLVRCSRGRAGILRCRRDIRCVGERRCAKC